MLLLVGLAAHLTRQGLLGLEAFGDGCLRLRYLLILGLEEDGGFLHV